MWKIRAAALLILAASVAVGYFAYEAGGRFPYRLGLDLSGGTHLLYRADVSGIPPGEEEASLEALRDVIERRINIFGVSEPLLQVERASALSGTDDWRLIVELPGVTDIAEAVRAIGETPVLEFKLLREGYAGREFREDGTLDDEAFAPTGLTGRYLKRASLVFGNAAGGVANEPIVSLEFDGEGAALFERVTRENVGRVLAIFLDGAPISMPVIREAIPEGRATISGNFRPDEARLLARNLSFGALPVPVELVSTQSIGASLGEAALERGVFAGLVAALLVALFMLLWYRLPGVLAVAALAIYVSFMLALFKLIPVTLTAAGIAGFILSIGMAVDANILIFERLKEELRAGKTLRDAIALGFSRAWLSIRDGNISSIITAVILFWFGTSLVKGFALTFGLGVLVSMLTAISVSRLFLRSFERLGGSRLVPVLFGSGLRL